MIKSTRGQGIWFDFNRILLTEHPLSNNSLRQKAYCGFCKINVIGMVKKFYVSRNHFICVETFRNVPFRILYLEHMVFYCNPDTHSVPYFISINIIWMKLVRKQIHPGLNKCWRLMNFYGTSNWNRWGLVICNRGIYVRKNPVCEDHRYD